MSIIKEYTWEWSQFRSEFAKIAWENDKLAEAAIQHIPKDTNMVCDFWCWDWKHLMTINNVVSPKTILAVDNSKDQLISAMNNTTIENVEFNHSISFYKNSIDAVLSKHTFVTMDNEIREKTLFEIFNSMIDGWKLIIAETNLEEHVKNLPDSDWMSMQTKCEAYPALNNVKDWDNVATILKLNSKLADCVEWETKMTLKDKMHTIDWIKKLLTKAWFLFKWFEYVDSDEVERAYILYIAQKPYKD
jgi:hypothetical protein